MPLFHISNILPRRPFHAHPVILRMSSSTTTKDLSPLAGCTQGVPFGGGGAHHRKIKGSVRNGELPPRTDAAALGKFYMTVMQGMTIQASNGATKKELLAVARAAMLKWPDRS
jgi:hypothetical protein